MPSKPNKGMRAPLYACLVSVLAATFLFANLGIVKQIEEVAIDTTNRHRKKRGANHVDVKTVRRKEAVEEKLAAVSKRKPKRKSNKEKDAAKTSTQKTAHYHDNAVFITHYHKTGYVLSRELMILFSQIERETNRPNLPNERGGAKYEVSGVDENGERYAFDAVGSWSRSAFSTRKYHSKTQCPFPLKRKQAVLPKTKGFTLRDGTIYVQESPDFYCSDEDILEGLTLSHEGGTKIIHFVRNPYEMVLSNYFYHSQDPTPGEFMLEIALDFASRHLLIHFM
jgi:hypothetical protein